MFCEFVGDKQQVIQSNISMIADDKNIGFFCTVDEFCKKLDVELQIIA